MSDVTRLTPKEACCFLGCGYDFLMGQVRRGLVPHFRLGRRVMFTRERLTEWVQQQQDKSLRESR
jgi:excisionase family DNA binding protein